MMFFSPLGTTSSSHPERTSSTIPASINALQDAALKRSFRHFLFIKTPYRNKKIYKQTTSVVPGIWRRKRRFSRLFQRHSRNRWGFGNASLLRKIVRIEKTMRVRVQDRKVMRYYI
jgi:hypothetical protein